MSEQKMNYELANKMYLQARSMDFREECVCDADMDLPEIWEEKWFGIWLSLYEYKSDHVCGICLDPMNSVKEDVTKGLVCNH